MSGKHLRVAFLIGSLARGGAEANLLMLARGLRGRGHRVLLMTLRPDGAERAAELQAEGIEVFDVDLPKLRPLGNVAGKVGAVRAMTRTVGRLREFKPHVVHAWLFEAEVWGAIATLLLRRGAFVSTRQSLGQFKDAAPWKQRAQNLCNRLARAVVANSRAVAADARRRERNLPPDRLHVVHSGVEAELIATAPAADLPRAFGISFAPEPVALCVSNLFAYKGILDLVEAWSIVRDYHPRAVLVVVGRDGGVRAEAKRRIAALKLEANVLLVGERDDVPALLRGADFLVHASHEEGLPSAILEAMAAGLAVASTNVGGIPEIVEEGKTGFLAPPRDPKALAEAILRLAGDERLRARLGAEAARRARTKFSPASVVDAHEAIYRAVIAERRASRT